MLVEIRRTSLGSNIPLWLLITPQCLRPKQRMLSTRVFRPYFISHLNPLIVQWRNASLSRAVTARNSCETGELGNCLICLQRPNKDPALSESQTVKDQDAKPRDGGPSQKEHSWGSWSGYQRQTDMVTWSSTETPNIRRFSFFSGNQWLIVDVHFGMRNQGFLASKWTVAVDL